VGRIEVILLDTHAAVWFANDTRDLGQRANAVLDRALAGGELAISAVSIWEIALLHAKKRLRLRESPAMLRRQLLDGGVVELSLTGEIALRSVDLGGLPPDPTDRFIAATAIIHDATLVTADEKLLRWRHALKRLDATK
jgi:PIN domain nuclease of toxin-antitoxin system